MDNSKKNIHTSGALGVLLKSGKIKKIEESSCSLNQTDFSSNLSSSIPPIYKTESGVKFSEQELMYIDPKECEPWKYANRHESELGNMDDLIKSIRENKQLQPALIREHSLPHDDVKYEIIFGRRRHLACLELGIPFLVIIKKLPNVQDAIAAQDAENKLRNDVSNYSNAILYSRLIDDGIFKNEKDLADKLRISSSTFNDLMAFSKIPKNIVNKIPDIHGLSKQLAVKIIQLLNKSKENYEKIESIADKIGVTIKSQAKLEKSIESIKIENQVFLKKYNGIDGRKLFTFKADGKGLPSIVLDKEIAFMINHEDLCLYITGYIERSIQKSGCPE